MMNEKSQIETEYEKYLTSDNKYIEIDGTKFYKIIHKEKISLDNGTVLICVPFEMLDHASINKIKDEDNRSFNIGGPVHYSFISAVPRWYTETMIVTVEGISDIDEIGDYVSLDLHDE